MSWSLIFLVQVLKTCSTTATESSLLKQYLRQLIRWLVSSTGHVILFFQLLLPVWQHTCKIDGPISQFLNFYLVDACQVIVFLLFSYRQPGQSICTRGGFFIVISSQTTSSWAQAVKQVRLVPLMSMLLIKLLLWLV